MSTKSRLDRVEKSAQASRPEYSEKCICFPKRDYPQDFDRMEHYFAALRVQCPEHGQRVWREKSIVMCIRPERMLAQDWDMNWPHHPVQYRKAMRATFERREQYVLPMPEIKSLIHALSAETRRSDNDSPPPVEQLADEAA